MHESGLENGLYQMLERMRLTCVLPQAFSFPEAALLLVSTKNRDLCPVQLHSVFEHVEWLCKHNRLRSEPIRFVKRDSEHAQSDGKSVNRGLPVLDLAKGRDTWC